VAGQISAAQRRASWRELREPETAEPLAELGRSPAVSGLLVLAEQRLADVFPVPAPCH
jgi:hypothetical protein